MERDEAAQAYVESLFADFASEIQHVIECEDKPVKVPNSVENDRQRQATSEEYVNSLFGEAVRMAQDPSAVPAQ